MIIKLHTTDGLKTKILSPEDFLALVETFLEDPSYTSMEVNK